MEHDDYLSRLNLRNDIFRVLPNFTPVIPYRYFIINNSADTSILRDLVRFAQHCSSFTISTGIDLHDSTNTIQPTLIQIGFHDKDVSIVGLVQVRHVPLHRSSLRFWLIRSLFNAIFQNTKRIFVWGNLIHELSPFLGFGFFTMDNLEKPVTINVQQLFKHWHAMKYKYQSSLSTNWDLQLAIAITCHQFLDRTIPTQDLDQFLIQSCNNLTDLKILPIIHYACCECLATTKMACIINKDLLNDDSSPSKTNI